MCEPTMAWAAAQGGLSLIASKSQVDAQNEAAVSNAIVANEAAGQEYGSVSESYVENQKSLMQGAFDAIMEGRADEATAYTSAVQNGVQGNSLKTILNDAKQKTARSVSRTKKSTKSLKSQTVNAYKSIDAKARGRIASTPTTRLNIGDYASALTPIVKAGMD